MPNRYEREIEEILRNMEHTDPKSEQRFAARMRRKPAPPRTYQRRSISFTLSTTEWLLIIAVTSALLGSGYVFTLRSPGPGGLLTPALAVISMICVILVALSYYVFRPRSPRSPRSVRFGNTTVTPLRRGFFGNLKTRWHLFILRLRYQRRTKT